MDMSKFSPKRIHCSLNLTQTNKMVKSTVESSEYVEIHDHNVLQNIEQTQNKWGMEAGTQKVPTTKKITQK